ncbi:AMP-binding protein [Pengzhenrongella sicca]|uniref:AMP-binding protein n=1 Tax=Pengzhenrongella sicca TaxID=2819238 RepID=A0A8A4ZHV3_9MICO|nr:AMP-binding protein [Pengzhenrongella sicca]QTE30106.1 AMP-binding protein [Pengzhenrongella sicca]
MPDVDISPARAVALLARRAPGTASIVCADRTLSAAQVHAGVTRMAGVLAGVGVRAGDRVAYLGRNSPSALVLLLACAHLGAVYVPVNFRLAPREIGYVLRHSGARTVLVEPELAAACEPLDRGGPPRRWLLADDAATGAPAAPRAGWLRPIDVAVDVGVDVPGVRRTFDDLAVLMYTSGTTGRPKGVMLTHGNLWWSGVNMDEVLDTRRDDVNLAVAPMFHIGGLNAFALRTLVRGGTVVVRRTFDAERTLADLAGGRITTVFGVPTMFAAVARCEGFAVADLSGVRVALIAGSAVPPSLIHAFAERGLPLQQSWGMTETSPGCTFVPRELALAKAGSAGLPLPDTELRLVDPATGTTVAAAGATGELFVRGPNVTPGYWNDPDATRAALTTDGWLRSGDLAQFDDDGWISIVGRRSTMINTGGENVYPAEVERALTHLPGITGVAVVGVPDPAWGESVLAVLECPAGTTPPLADVRAFAALGLARYKLPSQVLGMCRLPRTESGKVDQVALRSLAAAAAAGAATAAADTGVAVVAAG